MQAYVLALFSLVCHGSRMQHRKVQNRGRDNEYPVLQNADELVPIAQSLTEVLQTQMNLQDAIARPQILKVLAVLLSDTPPALASGRSGAILPVSGGVQGTPGLRAPPIRNIAPGTIPNDKDVLRVEPINGTQQVQGLSALGAQRHTHPTLTNLLVNHISPGTIPRSNDKDVFRVESINGTQQIEGLSALEADYDVQEGAQRHAHPILTNLLSRLPKPWQRDKSSFTIGGRGFSYGGDLWFSQGEQSIVSYATRDDGLNVIMKRPKYTDTNWDDNLKKESFIARYLNAAGAERVATCVGQKQFSAGEVQSLKRSQHSEKWAREWENKGEWHAIFLEKVPGSPQDKREWGRPVSLGDPIAEQKAVRQMIETTAQMLNAGVVNEDQWHNILFTKEGDIHFIDLEGAKFINETPLQVAKAAGESLEYTRRIMLPRTLNADGTASPMKFVVEVTEHEKGLLLNEDQAEKAVKGMVQAILHLIPKHAIPIADEAIRSRVHMEDKRLDRVFDQAWREQKAWYKQNAAL